MVNAGALLRQYVKASLLESRSVLEEIPVCNFTSIDDFSNWLQKNAEKISAIQANFKKSTTSIIGNSMITLLFIMVPLSQPLSRLKMRVFSLRRVVAKVLWA